MQSTTKQGKLAKFIDLVRKMRTAQISFDEKRDYGSLVTVPLKNKAKALEQQVDKYLEDTE